MKPIKQVICVEDCGTELEDGQIYNVLEEKIQEVDGGEEHLYVIETSEKPMTYFQYRFKDI
jgi:hypothetical protein